MNIAESKTVFLGAVTELDMLMRAGFWSELIALLSRVENSGVVFKTVPVLDHETAFARFVLGHTSADELIALNMRMQSKEMPSGVCLTAGTREITPYAALYELYCAEGDPAHGCEKPHALIANVHRGIESRVNALLRHAESTQNDEFQLDVHTFTRKYVKDFRETRERLSSPPQLYPTSWHNKMLLRVAMRFWHFA